MSARFEYHDPSHPGIKALRQLEAHLHRCSLEVPLLELVKFRASQINGCAFCLDMHSKEARAAGEAEQRLHMLSAWRETSLYSERERAALAWAEAVTLLADTQVPDEVYEHAHAQFSDDELLDLTLAVASINSWNRLGVSARAEGGDYQPGSV